MREIQAFNKFQRSMHLHYIHFMVIFFLTGLPQVAPHTFRWLLYFFWMPFAWFSPETTYLSGGMKVAMVLHRLAAAGLLLWLPLFVLREIKNLPRWQIWPEGGPGAGIAELLKHYFGFKPARFGKYNFGQKCLAWLTILGTGIMVASGCVLLFKDAFSPAAWRWARFFHDVGFVIFLVILPVHIYMALHPLNRKGFRAMFETGTLPEDYVKTHHPVWWEKLKRKGEVGV